MRIKLKLRPAALLLAVMLALTACQVPAEPSSSGETGVQTESSGETVPSSEPVTAASSEEPTQPTEETPTETEPVPLGPPTYTLRITTEQFFGDLNPFSEGNEERDWLLSQLTLPLYRLGADGLAPELAAGDPKDVTAEHVGSFALEEGAEKQAYLITLREGMLWEDGKPLTAYDLEASAQRLLDPAAGYEKADLFFRGALTAAGAERYHIAGSRVLLENALYAQYTEADLVRGEDGIYRTPEGGIVYMAISFRLADWLKGHSLKEYMIFYGEQYFSDACWAEILAAENAEGLIPLTDETRGWVLETVTGKPAWGDSEEDLPRYFVYETAYPEIPWSAVGIRALTDTDLLIVTEKPIEAAALKLALSEIFLTEPSLYDACTAGGQSLYGTSAETFRSCGPFRLGEWEAGQGMVLVRNENYYRWLDGSAEGMTEEIRITFMASAEERLACYLDGKTDLIRLTEADREAFADSELTVETAGTRTYFLAMNPDGEVLLERQQKLGENINKTILTLPAFRRALSLSVDRELFCLTATAGNRPAYGLISSSVMADPETGLLYRDTEAGQAVLSDYWGLSSADDPAGYAYDPLRAAALMEQAYREALEQGLMDGDDLILLTIGIPEGSSDFYEAGYRLLTETFTEVAANTSLAGRIFFEREELPGSSFASALREKQADLLFGVGFEGLTSDPWSMMEVYTSPRYQYDPAWDTAEAKLSVAFEDGTLTASVRAFAEILRGETREVETADGEPRLLSLEPGSPERLTLLAALEAAVLGEYDLLPLMEEGRMYLRSARLVVGEDGRLPEPEDLCFAYFDEEWDRIAEAGGAFQLP